MQMIFENGTIITVDERRRVIEDGAVVVDGDRIAAVGKREEMKRRFPDYERYDAKGGIILPGLVDCHVHMSQALIRGCADNMALVDWLKRVWRCQGNFSEEDGKVAAELCILEMIKSGTTAFVETMIASRYGFNGMAQAVDDSGIRAALSKIVMDNPGFGGEYGIMYPGQVEEKESSISEALAMHEKWQGAAEGRIQVWFGPRPLGTGGTSIETMKEIIELAREHDIPINIHYCEIRSETIHYKREFAGYTPGRLTGWLEDIGLLGPKTLLIHVNWLEPEDIPNLARTGTHVVHNPCCNTKLASGFALIPEMIAGGVNVSLGCDGGPSNNTYDMIQEMRFAGYIHRARLLDPLVMDNETVIEMATINGAKVMGREKEFGSLEAGKKADLIILDTDKSHLIPAPDPVSICVCAANGSDVRTMMIDGKMIMDDRRVLTMDEEDIKCRAREHARAVFERAGVKIRTRWPVE